MKSKEEKNYSSPEITVSQDESREIITGSPEGTETTPHPGTGGIWDLDV